METGNANQRHEQFGQVNNFDVIVVVGFLILKKSLLRSIRRSMRKRLTNEDLNDYVFLSNIYDPDLPDASRYVCTSYQAFLDPNQRKIEVDYHFKWVNDNFIGPPKATEAFSQERMIRDNYVGIYKKK